jgi:molecular chaperone GrpE
MTDETAQQQQDGATDAEAGGPDMVPAEQVKAALEAAGDFKDKLLRALAEMENLRKRTEREVADVRTYAVTSFARDVLQVADNMHRALDTIGDELRETADSKVTALLEGIDLTERELTKVLEKHGVKMFAPLGEKFDPNFHQAMYEIPDPAATPGTVAQVIQAGYLIGDRVLRPAMVAVAKAPAKGAANESSSD